MKKIPVFFFTATFSPNTGIIKSCVKLTDNKHNPEGKRKYCNIQWQNSQPLNLKVYLNTGDI